MFFHDGVLWDKKGVRSQLVVAQRTAAVDCVFSTITKALKKKDTVALVGFGPFKVGQRKTRNGRNPQTGEEIKIMAKKVPKFVSGKALKDAVG